jgi:hypothetical protein
MIAPPTHYVPARGVYINVHDRERVRGRATDGPPKEVPVRVGV